MPERLTRAPGVEVPAPEDGSVLRYSGEAVQDVLDFFQRLRLVRRSLTALPGVAGKRKAGQRPHAPVG